MSPRVLFIQHDHASPAGPIAERFAQRGFDVEYFQVVPEERYLEPNVAVTFPDLTRYDVVVPMGAAWGAWDDEGIGRWLAPELDAVRAAQAAGVPMLGICFGGQLLARALGGSVAPAPSGEFGWHVVHSDDEKLVPQGPWFQWHHDRFVPPPGAREVARSPKASQAFVIGRTLGLQFHPEVTSDVFDAWLTVPGGADSLEGDGVDVDVLRAQTRHEDEPATRRAHDLVDAFLDEVASREP